MAEGRLTIKDVAHIAVRGAEPGALSLLRPAGTGL
jgi:hypothetical protein